jgi:hypothetical protein
MPTRLRDAMTFVGVVVLLELAYLLGRFVVWIDAQK